MRWVSGERGKIVQKYNSYSVARDSEPSRVRPREWHTLACDSGRRGDGAARAHEGETRESETTGETINTTTRVRRFR